MRFGDVDDDEAGPKNPEEDQELWDIQRAIDVEDPLELPDVH